MEKDVSESTDRQTKQWLTWWREIISLRRLVWPLALGLIGATAGVLIYISLLPAPEPLTQNDVDQSIVEAMSSATPPPAFSAEVYQIILPSLVFIQSGNEAAAADDGVSIGTGVVINDSGDILTAHHVVAGSEEIEVFFADGSRATAVIISAEPENDIAVLHPTTPPGLIVPAVLGSAGALRIGDEAYAVGNPLGLSGSMSAGVISGFNRSLPLNDAGGELEGLIQFDAAVNPGNSGGPLLNRGGQVVGIVTALANPTEQNFFIGIGFAVPIDTAVAVAGGPNY